jgi:hypothetical protein
MESFARYFAHKGEGSAVAQESDYREFHEQMAKLYEQMALEAMGGNCIKQISFVAVGASPLAPLYDLKSHESFDVMSTMKRAFQKKMIPTLMFCAKKFAPYFHASSAHQWMPTFFQEEMYEQQFQGMLPMEQVRIYGSESNVENVGLSSMLQDDLQGAFSYGDVISQDDVDEDKRSILFLFKIPKPGAVETETTVMRRLLKLAMSGHYVVMDLAVLSGVQKNLLESFIQENQLKRVQVDVHAKLEVIVMGEDAGLCLFHSEQFKELSKQKCKKFWQQVFKVLPVQQMQLDLPKEIKCLWLARTAGSMEFHYEQMRRLFLVNSTGNTVSAVIQRQKDHQFIKSVDSSQVEMKSTVQCLELTFKPFGSISLDFGVIEGEEE